MIHIVIRGGNTTRFITLPHTNLSINTIIHVNGTYIKIDSMKTSSRGVECNGSYTRVKTVFPLKDEAQSSCSDGETYVVDMNTGEEKVL